MRSKSNFQYDVTSGKTFITVTVRGTMRRWGGDSLAAVTSAAMAEVRRLTSGSVMPRATNGSVTGKKFEVTVSYTVDGFLNTDMAA